MNETTPRKTSAKAKQAKLKERTMTTKINTTVKRNLGKVAAIVVAFALYGAIAYPFLETATHIVA